MRPTFPSLRAPARTPATSAGCLLALAVVACGCAAESSGKDSGGAASKSQTLVQTATQRVEHFASSAATALAGLAGGRKAAAAPEEKEEAAPPPPPRRRLARPKPAPEPVLAEAGAEADALLAAPVRRLAFDLVPAVAPESFVRRPPDPALYSSDDADVAPPEWQVRSVSATQLPGRPADLPTLELIIGADGAVERARLLSAAKQLPDMMILSSAKMWRFEPAVRDGMAVRYRMILRWN